MRFIIALVFSASSLVALGQDKEKLVKEYVVAFNQRDIERFVNLFDDSVKQIKFPNIILERSKSELRKSYEPAFKSKQLGGQITILGSTQMGDRYIIEQSLRDEGATPIDQYLIFKFKGNLIVEVQYLPKNFSWTGKGLQSR